MRSRQRAVGISHLLLEALLRLITGCQIQIAPGSPIFLTNSAKIAAIPRIAPHIIDIGNERVK